VPGTPGRLGSLRYENPARLLYLGACTREKGLFAALDALAILERETPGEYFLTIAGSFTNPGEARAFHERLAADDALRRCARYDGPADETRKHALHAGADIFVFPTRYAHEAQPLVLIEALAHDLPIVTTRWRAIPGMLPRSAHAQIIAPDATPRQLADAIRAARAAGPANGALRAHYETHFTRAAHLSALARALREV
jgi:glycosyltransferase involved in cell wall biosynthesis